MLTKQQIPCTITGENDSRGAMMKGTKRWIAVVATVTLLCATLFGQPHIQSFLEKKTATADKDADGMQAYIEELFGTADETDDTDGDGVSDYTEIFKLSTDPLAADADTDSDGDTLTNATELSIGTDPGKRDTDADGLADGDERTCGSDPLVYDCDADGVRDGYELELGTDPCTPQDVFDVSVSCGENAVSVGMTLAGEAVETLCVEPTLYDRFFTEDVPGCISEAYDVSMDGAFENGTISFSVQTDAVEPTVYYFSEATQTLEPIITSLNGDEATASITAAGTYILLDRTVYESSFVWEDRWGSSFVYAGLEIVVVIDDSASMKRTDPNGERLEVTRRLIDRLPEGARIGVVRFATDVTVMTTSLTTDREQVKSYLTPEYFSSNGQTYMYTAIQSALPLFDTQYEATQKIMIVISDGQPTDRALYNETVALVAAQPVETFTIAFGEEFLRAQQIMEGYATAVGGTHYTAQNADELTVVYDALSQSVHPATDTDGDGIPDYYEDNMIAFNGVKVALDKTKADTDEDGVPDGEEVKVELVYSEDGNEVYVKGILLSDPTLSDTDGDGTPDDVDEAPYDNTYTAAMTSEYATGTMALEMDYAWFFEDNTVYNPALSEASSLFAAMAYEPSSVLICNSLKETSASLEHLTDVLTYFGMENAQSYSLIADYNDSHVSEVVVGYRNVSMDGELRTVLAVVVRGTNATIEEWSSNCDIGDITKDTPEDDWRNTDNHKGFDVAANRIAAYVDRYIEENGLYRDNIVYWVTGHSRGAGIANILGANFEKAGETAFTYTFAAPNTTLASDAASYKTIFNIINADDFVPCLPLADWGYTCYGSSTKAVSVRESYESMWETYTGIWDYDSDASNMENCVTTIGKILTAGSDPRVDCYRYTCSCHGDGSNDTITITNTGMSESSRDKAIAKIPANARTACIITKYDGGFLGGWDFDVCQSPAYFMQLLAAFMGGEIDAYRFAVELNIADRYESAKSALVEVGISGVKHPHYPETYCMLAGVLTAEAFE